MSFAERLTKLRKEKEAEKLKPPDPYVPPPPTEEEIRKEKFLRFTQQAFNPILQTVKDSFLEGREDANITNESSPFGGGAKLVWDEYADMRRGGSKREIEIEIDGHHNIRVGMGEKTRGHFKYDQKDWKEKVEEEIEKGLKQGSEHYRWEEPLDWGH